ncbi:hypothetical protein [Streptomyces sp.]|uniref:hypothetical protein n=1 Tax=Streptomyces sp. TaxID=1931 RepID=UPI002F93539D
MARIQILELPEGAGDERPPFALVIDQANSDSLGSLRPWLEGWENVKDQIGARAVLVFEDTIGIPANEVPVDPDGYPLKIRIEGDFEKFREQVEEEIQYAHGKVTRALRY